MQPRTKHTCTCEKCAAEFGSFNPDAKHCDKHRYLSSPAYLAKLKHKVAESAETRRLKKKEYSTKWRRDKGMKPLIQIKKEAAVKKRKVTSAVILPVIIVPAVAQEPKNEAKIWLQVDKRTRIGFIDEDQMRKWKEKHKFNN